MPPPSRLRWGGIALLVATGIEEHQKGERQGSEAQRQGQRLEEAGPPDSCGWGDGQLPPGYLSLLLKGHRHLTMCKSLMFKHPVKQFLDPLKSKKMWSIIRRKRNQIDTDSSKPEHMQKKEIRPLHTYKGGKIIFLSFRVFGWSSSDTRQNNEPKKKQKFTDMNTQCTKGKMSNLWGSLEPRFKYDLTGKGEARCGVWGCTGGAVLLEEINDF